MTRKGQLVMDNIDPHSIGQWISPAGILAAIGAVFGALPIIFGSIGGAFAIVYYAITIYEKPTVQSWLRNKQARRLASEVAYLELQQSHIVGRLKQLGVLTHAATDVKQGDMRKTITTVETSTQPVQEASRDA